MSNLRLPPPTAHRPPSAAIHRPPFTHHPPSTLSLYPHPIKDSLRIVPVLHEFTIARDGAWCLFANDNLLLCVMQSG